MRDFHAQKDKLNVLFRFPSAKENYKPWIFIWKKREKLLLDGEKKVDWLGIAGFLFPRVLEKLATQKHHQTQKNKELQEKPPLSIQKVRKQST